MAATTDEVWSAVQRLARALLGDVERIAGRSVARMQELVPSSDKVPGHAPAPVTLTNTGNRDGEIRELERLAAEQAALRGVATMVARESSPREVFAKVAEDLSTLLNVPMVRMIRFEPDDTATLLAARKTDHERLPLGTNVPIPKGSVIERIFQTGKPARVEDYSQVEGPIGDLLRQEGVRWAVGGPIVVDGRLWGAMVVGSSLPESSSETEERVAQFAELVSTAISNIESRTKVEQLAAEQSALRRVAELVARQAPPEEVFGQVTDELSRLLEVNMVRTVRFDPDGTATILAARGTADDGLTEGTNFEIPEGSAIGNVLRTGRPARVDGFAEVTGPIGAALRERGAAAGVGGPIVVGGRLWGAMAVGARNAKALPPGSEHRVAQFAELISTAISNVESRAEVERLAAEQAALRRVAELVAQQAPPDEVFALVTEELNRLLDVTTVGTGRFEPDGTVTIMAVRGTAQEAFPPGTTVALEGGSAIEQVFRTGRPAHVENYDSVGGHLGHVMRKLGAGWAAAGPIVVDGRLWGAMTVNSGSAVAYPAGAEQRVAQFTELVSTAISNIESRAKVERLAAEQSALRHVATLVASEHSPEELFQTLVQEVRVLLGVDASEILRYEADATATMVAGWSDAAISLPVGQRLRLEGENLASEVQRTGAPAHKEDYRDASGAIAALSRQVGIRSAVASPIVVEGTTWGMIAVASRGLEPLPAETEARLAEFSQVAGMAVANAKSRSDLAESRARIVRAGDEARRRFERDLHDGAQQRLVSLGLDLRTVEATVPPELGSLRDRLSRLGTGMNDVLDNLRELSRGLHPAVLSEDGLSPALSSLALRSGVPVDLRLDLGGERFEEAVEVAAYYVASEALTNTAKHARASRAEVEAIRRDGLLELIVRDDGRGGAVPSSGSGLTGLVDRVEAIGGTMRIDSRPGRGTSVHVKLPVKRVRS
jgi:GAF domain-containing protein